MDENNQDKSESTLTVSEDKSTPATSSPQDQIGTDQIQNNQMKDTIKQLRDRGDRVTEEYSTTGQLSKVSGEHQPRKTWWDWLQLVLLVIGAIAVSASILVGVWQFSTQQKASAQLQATQVAASAAQALDQQRQITLETYLDRMSDLLLTYHLATQTRNEVLALAESRTYTAVRSLDGVRKGTLVRFLLGARLISGQQPIMSVSNADLSGAIFTNANLMVANLSEANLSGAIFTNADLSGAIFTNANLRGTDFSGALLLAGTARSKANCLLPCSTVSGDLRGGDLPGADLSGADLSGANITTDQLNQAASLKGAIMPNGSKHP